MQTPATDHEIAEINGIRLAYRVLGSGRPLLLLHGFTGSGDDWQHAFDLEALAGEHRLIVPDLRGHGRSTNPSGTFTHRQCGDDVLALLDHLGLDTVDAIGLSLGGNTLLHASTRQPQRFEAQVLISAPSHFPDTARAIMRSMTEETRSEAEWAQMRQRHAHGDDQIRALWAIARGFADDVDDMAFTPPRLATISARTLLVTGDRDPFYPVALFADMQVAIPDAYLWVVPGGGHGPIFAGARDEFRRLARAHLRGPLAA